MNAVDLSKIDTFTIRHLYSWIKLNLPSDEWDAAFDKMLSVIADDFGLSDLGWWRVYDIANS